MTYLYVQRDLVSNILNNTDIVNDRLFYWDNIEQEEPHRKPLICDFPFKSLSYRKALGKSYFFEVQEETGNEMEVIWNHVKKIIYC
jgi:hypothetical protein